MSRLTRQPPWSSRRAGAGTVRRAVRSTFPAETHCRPTSHVLASVTQSHALTATAAISRGGRPRPRRQPRVAQSSARHRQTTAAIAERSATSTGRPRSLARATASATSVALAREAVPQPDGRSRVNPRRARLREYAQLGGARERCNTPPARFNDRSLGRCVRLSIPTARLVTVDILKRDRSPLLHGRFSPIAIVRAPSRDECVRGRRARAAATPRRAK